MSSWDVIGTPAQGPVKTHGIDQCAGALCVIHNPSDHPLKDAPLSFRMDRMALAERHCEHGVGHPDPDSVAHFDSLGIRGMGVHGCCGSRCCTKENS